MWVFWELCDSQLQPETQSQLKVWKPETGQWLGSVELRFLFNKVTQWQKVRPSQVSETVA